MTPMVYQYTSVKECHDAFLCAHSVNGVEPGQIQFSVTGKIFT